MHINDAILAKTAGKTVQEGMLAYYLANGATSLDLDDAEREYLLANGAGFTEGTELVTDPGFGNTVNWNEGAGWSLLAGLAIITPQAAKSSISSGTGITLLSGTRYIFRVNITNVEAGSVEVGLGALRLGVAFDAVGYNIETRTISGSNKTGVPLLEADIGSDMQITEFSIKAQTGGNIEQHINDLWDYYLRVVKGYTGSLDDMKMKFWTAP
jgi:hypothetical protein